MEYGATASSRTRASLCELTELRDRAAELERELERLRKAVCPDEAFLPEHKAWWRGVAQYAGARGHKELETTANAIAAALDGEAELERQRTARDAAEYRLRQKDKALVKAEAELDRLRPLAERGEQYEMRLRSLLSDVDATVPEWIVENLEALLPDAAALDEEAAKND